MENAAKELGIDLTALAEAGSDIGSLDERTIDQIRSIETAIAEELSNRAKIAAELEENPFTIRRMSRMAGLSRSTFYNKPLLADYLNARTKDLTVPRDRKRILELEQQLGEANATIAALRLRDGEFELLLQKYLSLEKQLKDKQHYIDHELSLLCPDLSAENHLASHLVRVKRTPKNDAKP